MGGMKPHHKSTIVGQLGEAGMSTNANLSGGGGSSGPLYDYGWPGGGTSEPNVVQQILFDVASGDLTEDIVPRTIYLPGFATNNPPTYEVDATDNLLPRGGIKYEGVVPNYWYQLHYSNSNALADYTLNNAFTVEWWEKNPSTSSGYGGIFTTGGPDKSFAGFLILAQDATTLKFQILDDTNLISARVDFTISATRYDDDYHKYRIVGTLGGTVELFLDGVTQGTGSLAGFAGATVTPKTLVFPMDGLGNGIVLREWRVSANATNNSGGKGGG